MINPYFLAALADEHVRDLRAAACRDRLRALARRCHPSMLTATLRRWHLPIRGGHITPCQESA